MTMIEIEERIIEGGEIMMIIIRIDIELVEGIMMIKMKNKSKEEEVVERDMTTEEMMRSEVLGEVIIIGIDIVKR